MGRPNQKRTKKTNVWKTLKCDCGEEWKRLTEERRKGKGLTEEVLRRTNYRPSSFFA